MKLMYLIPIQYRLVAHKTRQVTDLRCDQSADGVLSSIMMAPDPTSCEGPCVVLILLICLIHTLRISLYAMRNKR